jgi:hypothetical protein
MQSNIDLNIHGNSMQPTISRHAVARPIIRPRYTAPPPPPRNNAPFKKEGEIKVPKWGMKSIAVPTSYRTDTCERVA